MDSSQNIDFKGFAKTRFDLLHHLISVILQTTKNLIEHEPLLLFFVGTLFGSIIYYLAIHQIEILPLNMRTMLLSCLIVVASFAMVFFPSSSRCFLGLLVFNFFSSAGKIYLTSIVLNSILDGPVNNTMENIVQMMKSFKCQSDLVKHLGNIMNENELSSNNRILDEIRH